MKYISVLYYLIPSLIILLLGCNGGAKDKASTNTTSANTLPSISLEEMQNLHERCDYIDFIFYNMDFSMSVNTKNNIQQVVSFVDKAQPTAGWACPAMGRIIYQQNGQILLEADMHFDENCQHLVFYKNNKKTYINRLAPQGIAYFQQIFQKVHVVPK